MLAKIEKDEAERDAHLAAKLAEQSERGLTVWKALYATAQAAKEQRRLEKEAKRQQKYAAHFQQQFYGSAPPIPPSPSSSTMTAQTSASSPKVIMFIHLL